MTRPPKSSVYIGTDVIDRLTRRGAKPDRGRGPRSRSHMLGRQLDLLEAVVLRSDPRETHGLSDAFYDFAIRLLPDAAALSADQISVLEAHFKSRPQFRRTAEEAGIDPEPFLAAIEALPYAQKLHLVDQAEQILPR